MKKTLLQIVQDVLNEIDSDPVSDINETFESQQIAQIVKNVYEEISSNRNWPHQRKIFQLESDNTLSRPNYLKLPERLKELEFIKYDCIKQGETKIQYKDIEYKYPDEFLNLAFNLNSDLDNVIVVTDASGIKIPIRNDKRPEFWTSFDDKYLVFDSYDSNVDDTLKPSKSQGIGYFELPWATSNSFIPDLPSEAFALLVSESISIASLAYKQMPNQKAEQRSSRQNRWLSRKAWQAKGGIRYPNYGRK